MSLHLNSLFGAGRENKYSSLFLPLSFVAQLKVYFLFLPFPKYSYFCYSTQKI